MGNLFVQCQQCCIKEEEAPAPESCQPKKAAKLKGKRPSASNGGINHSHHETDPNFAMHRKPNGNAKQILSTTQFEFQEDPMKVKLSEPEPEAPGDSSFIKNGIQHTPTKMTPYTPKAPAHGLGFQ